MTLDLSKKTCTIKNDTGFLKIKSNLGIAI